MIHFHFLLSGIAAAYCVLGLWATVSRQHWFLRAAVVCGALALLVPIEAYEPLALLFLTSIAFVCLSMLAAYLWPGQSLYSVDAADSTKPVTRRSLRFSLRDIFLASAVAASISLLIGMFIRQHGTTSWENNFGGAIVFYVGGTSILFVFTLCLSGIAADKRWRWYWAAAFVIAVPLALAIDRASNLWMPFNRLLHLYRVPYLSNGDLTTSIFLYVCFTFWLLILSSIGLLWLRPTKQRFSQFLLRAATVPILLFCATGLAWLYWQMLPSPNKNVPSFEAGDNVLPRILALGEKLSNASPNEAQAIYNELLPLSRKSGHAILDWDPATTGFAQTPHWTNSQAIKHPMRDELLRLAAEGRHDEAAEFALATIRLGEMHCHGGVIETFETGDSIEGGGQGDLMNMRRSLSREKQFALIKLFEQRDANREPFSAVVERSDRWHAEQLGWIYRLETSLLPEPQDRPLVRALEDNHVRIPLFDRMLAIDLACRVYRADRGQWPQTLDALVPQYLSRIPEDPLSGKPFVYRPSEPEFTLYSIGADGVDEKGATTSVFKRSIVSTKPGFDIDLDIFTRQ